mgnify:CR=1 FL=1
MDKKKSIFEEVTEEEQEEMIKKVYEIISKYGVEDAALLLLYGFKPLAPLGGALGRFFLGPFLPLIGRREEVFISTFEQTSNIDKLIKLIEEGRGRDKKKSMKQKASKEKRGD